MLVWKGRCLMWMIGMRVLVRVVQDEWGGGGRLEVEERDGISEAQGMGR